MQVFSSADKSGDVLRKPVNTIWVKLIIGSVMGKNSIAYKPLWLNQSVEWFDLGEATWCVGWEGTKSLWVYWGMDTVIIWNNSEYWGFRSALTSQALYYFSKELILSNVYVS